jgi:hypothetical protein
MTDLRKAAEMALDALRLYVTMYPQMDKGYMVDARETLRQALAQPEQAEWRKGFNAGYETAIEQAEFKALKEAEEQEPVAWMLPDYGDVLSASEADGTGIYSIPLYTAPPKPEPKSISTNEHLCAMLRQVHDVLACTALPMKRQWVGLTDEQLSETYNELYTQYTRDDVNIADFILIARTIESQLKEKSGAI